MMAVLVYGVLELVLSLKEPGSHTWHIGSTTTVNDFLDLMLPGPEF